MKRTALVRTALAAAASCVIFGSASPARATITILADNFTGGSSVLNGRVTTTGGATWVDASAAAFGTVSGGTLTASGQNNKALLPFIPQSGKVYTLSATLSTTAGWTSLGFQSGADEGAPWNGYTYDWGRLAPTQAYAYGGNYTANSMGSTTVSAASHTISLTLDTTNTQWVASAKVDGNAYGTPYTYTTNPTIDHLWVGRADNTTGTIQNLSLTSNGNPPPTWQVYSSISGGVQGQLHVPSSYNPATKYPIVVFLHGAGEIGTDNTKQISANITNLLSNAESRNFFLYCPQTARPNWGTADDLLAVTQNVARMTGDYNIDPNRIYVTGLSLGGGAVNMCATTWPNVFAGYVPLSAYNNPQIITPANASTVVGRPMWFYHGNADTTVGVSNSRNQVNYILQAQGQTALTSWASAQVPTFNFATADGKLHYTEYNGKGHNNDVWDNGAYVDANMYNWLLSQQNSTASLASGKSISITFTNVDWSAPPDRANVCTSTKLDSQSRTWNLAGSGQNTGYLDPRSLDNTVAFAQDTTGLQTTVNVAVTKSFFGGDDPLMPHALQSVSTLYDAFVTQRNWRVTSAQGELTFSGLTPGALYSMMIFASVNDTDGTRRYIGNYAVGGTSATLDAAQNLTNTITLNNLTADASGKLVLDITPTSGSRWAVVSAITLTHNTGLVPEPAMLGLLSLVGVLGMRRRRQ